MNSRQLSFGFIGTFIGAIASALIIKYCHIQNIPLVWMAGFLGGSLGVWLAILAAEDN